MRKDWIKIGILLIVAISLVGAYVHVITRETPDRIHQVFSIPEKTSINAIQVRNQYGEFSFHKENGEWRIKNMENRRADQDRLQMMESILRDMQVTRVLTEELPEYGLHSPAMKVEFTTEEGDAFALTVGNQTVSRAQFYASTGGEWTYLLDMGYLAPFDASATAFRDKEIFTIDKKQVCGISYLKAGEEIIDLKKSDDGWRIVAPFEAGAREIEIQEFLVQLQELQAVDWVTEKLSLQEIGMVPPEESLILTDASGKQQILEFGMHVEPYRYLRRSLEGDLYTVYGIDLDLSGLTPDQLIFESPFKSSIDQVKKIEISFEDQHYAFAVNTDSDEYTENGKPISRGDMVSIFMKYITILADGYDPFVPRGEPIGRFMTTYQDGQTVELLLYPREAGGYGMSVNGDTRFYVDAERVDKLLLWARKPLE